MKWNTFATWPPPDSDRFLQAFRVSSGFGSAETFPVFSTFIDHPNGWCGKSFWDEEVFYLLIPTRTVLFEIFAGAFGCVSR